MYIILSRPKAPVNAITGRLVANTRPTVHQTYEEAKAEAERLATREVTKEFLIFQTQIGVRADVNPPTTFIPT